MSDTAAYEALVSAFLQRQLSVADFTSAYLDYFKADGTSWDEATYRVLDELFADVDSFTDDRCLGESRPHFYLDEAALRVRAARALKRLEQMRD